MKRFTLGVVCGLLIGLILATAALTLADTPIRIVVDGREINADPPPIMNQSRVYVPIRLVSEALGADVSWNGYMNTVYITSKGGNTSDSTDPNYRERLIHTRNMIIDDYNYVYHLHQLSYGGIISAGDKRSIETKNDNLEEQMKAIANPPVNYQSAYNAVMDLYIAYLDYQDKATGTSAERAELSESYQELAGCDDKVILMLNIKVDEDNERNE
ncbi:MAG: copper amine oxidase N-terminal domain-containing protein [Firmicutes bacterium]|nr:copper amine oxidase N-terminal domain-containing protein [Bacillota bacterium]